MQIRRQRLFYIGILLIGIIVIFLLKKCTAVVEPFYAVPLQKNDPPVPFNNSEVNQNPINPLSELEHRVADALKRVVALQTDEIPASTSWSKPVVSFSEKDVGQSIDTFINNFTIAWNFLQPIEEQMKSSEGKQQDIWKLVNKNAVSVKTADTGARLVSLNISLIEKNHTFVKNFIVDVYLSPISGRPPQIISAKLDKGATKTDIESIMRGIQPLDPQYWDYMNTAANGELTDADRLKIIQDTITNAKKSNFLCFGSTKPDSRSRDECEASGGFWDQPVSNDTDCPFYQINKNWPNNRGGANLGGYCELPSGMQLLGFRGINPNPEYKPLCYNCLQGYDNKPGALGPCCEEQKDSARYPKLNGPDYKFPGDGLERESVKQAFIDRGLNYN